MLNFIDPDMANEVIATHVKKWFRRENIPVDTAELRVALNDFRQKFADYIVKNIFNSDRLDYLFDKPMYYDTPFLMPVYYIVDALMCANRYAEGQKFESKLNHIFAERRQAPGAAYANAVAFKRMGREKLAFGMLKKLANMEDAEAVLRSGAFFIWEKFYTILGIRLKHLLVLANV